MQDPTQKPHTKNIELRITGPKKKKKVVLRELRKHGYVNTSDCIPWRELFPELEVKPEYSIILRAARNRAGLTQVELSEKTGIVQTHILRMENGTLEIRKDQAKRLSEVLDLDYRVFL
jgi:ribosome-binding protein aMBF1 (putative translation factor)